MPEPNGCHLPEIWGTKCPNAGYQPPVDSFPDPQGASSASAPLRPSCAGQAQGYQMPERRRPRVGPLIEGKLKESGRGVPNARTTAVWL